MPSKTRRGHNLRSECQGQEDNACILSDSFSLSISPTPATSDDSAYHTNSPSSNASSLSDQAVCSMRVRSSTWASSLRSLLKRLPKSPIKQSTGAAETVAMASGVSGNEVPKTEEEIDAFLAEVWRKDVTDNPRATASPVSNYIKRVTELKEFFDQKMAEISQREATYISELTYFDDTTPLITASQISSLDKKSLKRMLMESKLGFKFDELRFKVKHEVAVTILALRDQYVLQVRPRKSRRLKSKTTQLLNQWFEAHLDHPYPSEEEKQLLASEGGVTVEQVSVWFCNKRSRSKKMRTLHGRQARGKTKSL